MLQSETVKKYDTYKDSGIEWIGEIPQEWTISRNKNVFSCGKDIVGSASAITQLLSLTKKGVIKKDINNTEGKQPESFDTYQYVEIDDMVMCLFDLDCSAVFSGISNFNGMISPAYKILKCKNIVPKYADYWFRYISDGRKFNHYAKNIRFTLNYEEFSTLPILTPPLNIQQQIADYLDKKCGEIDRVVETEKSVIERLKEYKQSLITEAVTKGLDKSVPLKDSGIEWIGKIPQNWEVLKFSNIAKVKSNLVNPNEYLSYYQISPENIEKDTGNLLNNFGTVEESGVISGNHLFFKGQILYSKIRPNLNKVIIAPFDGLCSADMYPIETDINTNYFLYSMLSDTFVSQVKLFIENRVKMPKINQNELSNIYIAVPNDSNEQQQIAEYLDKKCSEIDKAIADKEQVIEKFTEYKKSLIYECVTGKRKVVE